MVSGDCMGPGLQLVRARFSNFLLRRLSREFRVHGMTQISNGHISILLEATVTWSSMLVVLYVLCILM